VLPATIKNLGNGVMIDLRGNPHLRKRGNRIGTIGWRELVNTFGTSHIKLDEDKMSQIKTEL